MPKKKNFKCKSKKGIRNKSSKKKNMNKKISKKKIIRQTGGSAQAQRAKAERVAAERVAAQRAAKQAKIKEKKGKLSREIKDLINKNSDDKILKVIFYLLLPKLARIEYLLENESGSVFTGEKSGYGDSKYFEETPYEDRFNSKPSIYLNPGFIGLNTERYNNLFELGEEIKNDSYSEIPELYYTDKYLLERAMKYFFENLKKRIYNKIKHSKDEPARDLLDYKKLTKIYGIFRQNLEKKDGNFLYSLYYYDLATKNFFFVPYSNYGELNPFLSYLQKDGKFEGIYDDGQGLFIKYTDAELNVQKFSFDIFDKIKIKLVKIINDSNQQGIHSIFLPNIFMQ